VTLRVWKFGGSSLATPDHIAAVSERIKDRRKHGDDIVVVASAMGTTTDHLAALADSVNPTAPARELDMVLSTGEMVAAPLLAMALHRIDVGAVAFTGAQAGITTTASHQVARITDVRPTRIQQELADGNVVVVAGFQGATETAEITTLGRGGSDTTAVALGVALHASEVEIFTDVDGVYSADPRVVSSASTIDEITYEEMLEFATVGARVMHARAVEIGDQYQIPIRVRSSFSDTPGTLICGNRTMETNQKVRGIAHNTDVAKVTVLGVPDRPGVAAAVFGPLGKHQINVDIIVQNVSHDGATDLSFTVKESDLGKAQAVLEEAARTVGARGVDTNRKVASVSVIGSGIQGTPGVFARIFETLASNNVNIEMISTSEIHVTCIVGEGQAIGAVRALHDAFELDRV